MDRAIVDLPQPDSPTSPSASPAFSWKLTDGITTASPARVAYATRRSRTSSSGASVTETQLAQADREEIEADDERRDRRARKQRHVRPHHHHPVRVLDHAAPVGIRRRQADAEETERADDDDVVAGAQAHVDHEWAPRVRQDLDQHDVER